MRKIYQALSVLILLVLSISACTPVASSTTQPQAMPEVTTVSTELPDAVLTPSETPQTMVDSPAWFDVRMANVNTGELFSINDFAGKVVLVETMAQWCSSCKKQQTEVKSLVEQFAGTSDLVVVILDIDPNETGDALKTYVSTNGFSGFYAVAPAEVARDIGNLYGAQFLNPPSTPVLIIDRKGEVHLLPFGIKSAEDLKEAVDPFLASS
jgi:thiol-disulfide isomerase/thioredoxin